MSFVETGDLRVHYALTGPAGAPLVMLSNSLGCHLAMWGGQAAALEKQFRVLRYDGRGQGQTSVTPGPYSIEQLARDAVGLLDVLEIEKAHFCGLSMGGMVGMWLGLHASGRFDSLALSNTAARIGTGQRWNARIEKVREEGMRAISDGVLEGWVSADFRQGSPDAVLAMRRMLESNQAEGYTACCAAVRDADFRDDVASIRLPALIIAGAKDPATPPADARFLAAQIPGARYAELDAAHLSNLESPQPYNAALLRFWTS